ncbi:hypothetical protein L226DRAFT_531068 [Lentinus tigrinus ALCF2SS1-7]|uniref:uncharacterized protein n=1 Tax=Lentinus tigrinus ALCF2SS1-7 TaxID=1328758 RepID=UPI0011661FC9|nr:hypothetical protein L226DRAFT_531068 [Lentinus tigrinus ALCF2SS1-7]
MEIGLDIRLCDVPERNRREKAWRYGKARFRCGWTRRTCCFAGSVGVICRPIKIRIWRGVLAACGWVCSLGSKGYRMQLRLVRYVG